MINVVVADDQSLIRSAVVDLLDGADDIRVLAEVADGAQAVEVAKELRPDVVVMDIRMPVLDGIAATERICAVPSLESTRVLVLTTFEDDAFVVAALRAGASGFVGKGSEPEEIVAAVRAVHRGDALLSPAATRGLIRTYLSGGGDQSPELSRARLSELTEREVEVLELVGRGLSNDELSAELFISPHTAKTHLKRIMMKLGAHDRAQLVIHAYETGLVRPGAE